MWCHCKQTRLTNLQNEFKSHWVLYSYGLVLHLSKKLSKLQLPHYSDINKLSKLEIKNNLSAVLKPLTISCLLYRGDLFN